VKAFLPGSRWTCGRSNLDKLNRREVQVQRCKVQQEARQHRAQPARLLEKERETLKKEPSRSLKEGAILTGIVKNLTDYGAFIDWAASTASAHHRHELGPRRAPSEMLNVGDELRVIRARFDPATERVSLGLKADPGGPLGARRGRSIRGPRASTGKVVSLTDYGASSRWSPGSRAWLHISEMSWTKRVQAPVEGHGHRRPVNARGAGRRCEGRRRISLGMKQIEPNPGRLLRAVSDRVGHPRPG